MKSATLESVRKNIEEKTLCINNLLEEMTSCLVDAKLRDHTSTTQSIPEVAQLLDDPDSLKKILTDLKSAKELSFSVGKIAQAAKVQFESFSQELSAMIDELESEIKKFSLLREDTSGNSSIV